MRRSLLVIAFTLTLTPLMLWPASQVVLLALSAVLPALGQPMSAPLWLTVVSVTTLVAILTAVLVAILLVRLAVRLDAGLVQDQLGSPGKCKECGYSLEGLTSDRCPEYGEGLSSGS